ncbi:DUF1624 domain-containing protein [Rudanella paleaurantiibacter]|uniref:DUF1624 domain-containing protein n=1 Tax=Rudanella paleaurantiibacter TaxID=2614655 RepID=A0A7J5TU76_9BACT|nr:heparan-alpha-glucosaminide N-acetyltransferase domain-containing protein [Rudanella paleaurantiibacter]KAB7727564.1 DUF1624 domain-containing protein [Rudanella paleaurantiibacter]
MQTDGSLTTLPIARNPAGRITSIDVVRGLVMVIMALDHVRDLLHVTATDQDPTNLATTTAPLFLTRWITHLCAPTFVFLSGTSAYLSLRKRNDGAARQFLLKRGLVLILFELTIVNFAFWFEIPFRALLLQVIYAIGAGFVILSFLARFRARTLGIVGLVILFGHNLLGLVTLPPNPAFGFVWALLFQTNFFQITPDFAVLVGYPVVPWLGIMLVGYGLGPLFEKPLHERKRTLARLGVGALVLFVGLRLPNVYGDGSPWSVQATPLFTVLSFINVSKYPPSLLYSLLMLGIALLLLAWADGVSNTVSRVLTVYGAVPMFYYILHWYLVHLLLLGLLVLQGFSLSNLNPAPFSFGRPKGSGVELGWVYLVWAGVVIGLYPLCKWYGRYKAEHPEKGWLRYV